MIVTTTDLQNSFGKYLQLCRNEEIIITRNGKNVAKLVSYSGKDADRWVLCEGAPADQSGRVRVSYEEYLKMTEASENRYEYIDGEIILQAAPLYPHQRAVKEIFGEFINWFRDKQCEPLVSPFDVTLYRLGNEKKINVVQPDILVICDRENIDQEGRYSGTPTLVVEVLSDSTRRKDLVQKLALYMESGVQEYWVVNTAASEIYIYLFRAHDIENILSFKDADRARSAAFPGLAVNLAQVFS